jgi:hypothetical protein
MLSRFSANNTPDDAKELLIRIESFTTACTALYSAVLATASAARVQHARSQASSSHSVALRSAFNTNSCSDENLYYNHATRRLLTGILSESDLLHEFNSKYTPALLGMQSTVWGDSPHAA